MKLLWGILTWLAERFCRIGFWLHRIVPNKRRLVLLAVLALTGAAQAIVIGPGESYQSTDGLGGARKAERVIEPTEIRGGGRAP